jgi:hypothetical protein
MNEFWHEEYYDFHCKRLRFDVGLALETWLFCWKNSDCGMDVVEVFWRSLPMEVEYGIGLAGRI